jgi:hypothetical protein
VLSAELIASFETETQRSTFMAPPAGEDREASAAGAGAAFGGALLSAPLEAEGGSGGRANAEGGDAAA